MRLTPDQLGIGPVIFAWRPGADALATLSTTHEACALQLWSGDGELQAAHTLPGSIPVSLDWDARGSVVAALVRDQGLFLWEAGDDPSLPPAPLLSKRTSTAVTFCRWSKTLPQLAIGTHEGKVLIYDRDDTAQPLRILKSAAHGGPILDGAWLSDNRLGIVSRKAIKVSQPLASTKARWEASHRLFLGGLRSKVPKHIRQAGEPSLVAFAPGVNPPVMSVALGTKYLVVADATGAHDDLALTFPDDYGGIRDYRWLSRQIVLVVLSEGFLVGVDCAALYRMQEENTLPTTVSAVSTLRVRPRPRAGWVRKACTHSRTEPGPYRSSTQRRRPCTSTLPPRAAR